MLTKPDGTPIDVRNLRTVKGFKVPSARDANSACGADQDEPINFLIPNHEPGGLPQDARCSYCGVFRSKHLSRATLTTSQKAALEGGMSAEHVLRVHD